MSGHLVLSAALARCKHITVTRQMSQAHSGEVFSELTLRSNVASVIARSRRSSVARMVLAFLMVLLIRARHSNCVQEVSAGDGLAGLHRGGSNKFECTAVGVGSPRGGMFRLCEGAPIAGHLLLIPS